MKAVDVDINVDIDVNLDADKATVTATETDTEIKMSDFLHEQNSIAWSGKPRKQSTCAPLTYKVC